MMFKSFAALSAAFSLFASSAVAVDPSLKNNVAIYYGQGPNQLRLKHFCEQTTSDIINIGFIHEFPKKVGDYPGSNFGNQCDGLFFPGTGLLNGCHQIWEDIPSCKAAGKTILLSIGGGSATAQSLPNVATAEWFADFLWYSFGPYNPSVSSLSWTAAMKGKLYPRPFRTNAVDGFDFDIEYNGHVGYAAMINRLRKHFATHAGQKYYISGAPQCPIPDEQLDDAISKSWFDFIWVQWYNTGACSASSGTKFNFNEWVKVIEKGANPNAKLFIGLPASPAAANKGFYLTPDQVKPLIQTYVKNKHFGGVMLWEATYGENNLINGSPFTEHIQDILYDYAPRPQPTTTTTTTTVKPTTTTTSSSTTTTTTSSSTTTTTTSSSTTTTTTSSSTTTTTTSSSTTTTTSSSTVIPSSSSTSSSAPTSSAATTSSSAVSSSSVIPSSSHPVPHPSPSHSSHGGHGHGHHTHTHTHHHSHSHSHSVSRSTPLVSGSSSTPTPSATESGASSTNGGAIPTGVPGDGTTTGGSKPTGGETTTGGSKPTGGETTSGGSKPTGGETTSGGSKPTGGETTSGGAKPTGETTTGGSKPTGTGSTTIPAGITGTPSVTASPSSLAPGTTTTIIVTSYIDICPTGFTTITTTITKTYCPGDATATAIPTGTAEITAPTSGPSTSTASIPEGWTTTVTVCTVCAATPTTVTLTKPAAPTTTAVVSQPTAPSWPEGFTTTVTYCKHCGPTGSSVTLVIPVPSATAIVPPASSVVASSSSKAIPSGGFHVGKPSSSLVTHHVPTATTPASPTGNPGNSEGVSPVYTGAASRANLVGLGGVLTVALSMFMML